MAESTRSATDTTRGAAPVTGAARIMTVVRILVGVVFLGAGLGKLADHAAKTANFTAWHIPAPSLAVIALGVVEVAGGILLALGIATRPVAAVFVGTMTAAFGFAGLTTGG